MQGVDRSDELAATGWHDGPPEQAPAGEIEVGEFTALDRFVADLQALQAKGGSGRLSSLVPRRSWADISRWCCL